jgi:hypothetical protein
VGDISWSAQGVGGRIEVLGLQARPGLQSSIGTWGGTAHRVIFLVGGLAPQMVSGGLGC